MNVFVPPSWVHVAGGFWFGAACFNFPLSEFQLFQTLTPPDFRRTLAPKMASGLSSEEIKIVEGAAR